MTVIHFIQVDSYFFSIVGSNLDKQLLLLRIIKDLHFMINCMEGGTSSYKESVRVCTCVLSMHT